MSRQVGAKRQKYSPEVLEHVAELVRSRSITLNQAAKKYCLPKTTLQNAVHFKYDGHKVGHKTILTGQEEERIASWSMHMARIGYGRTRQELTNIVKAILDDDGRPNPFHDNRPGRAWLDGFFRRHPNLTLRTTIQLGKERAVITPEKVNRWFQEFKKYIEDELGDKELLNDPTRIYNADETGVSLCLKGNQVVGVKGAPVVYHYGNSDKTQLTVMAACSAAAHFLPPMIIYPGKRFSYNPLEGFEAAAFGRSDSGWMDSEVFCQWLANVFIPAVESRNVKKPVLLLIDGHVTHVTMKASDICLQHNIEMYCLLEHASHIMQPLDLRLFSALKKNWGQAVRDWQTKKVGEYVTKITFARVFKKAWEASTTTDIAVKGFQEAGLFPVNPSVVSASVKIEPSKIFTSPLKITQEASKTAVLQESPAITDPNSEVSLHKDNESGTNILITQSSKQNSPVASSSHVNQPEPSQENDKQQNTTIIQHDSNAPPSPFSKHLTIPTPKLPKTTSVKRTPLPKAITGAEYRGIVQEKLAQREQEHLAKEKRKEERLKMRKQKEEEKLQKKADREASRKEKAEEKQRKRKIREQLLKVLDESGSESDGEIQVSRSQCFACERPYETDFIECSNCMRRFHIACIADEYINIEGLEFECKYC